jgi:hypothetical protein
MLLLCPVNKRGQLGHQHRRRREEDAETRECEVQLQAREVISGVMGRQTNQICVKKSMQKGVAGDGYFLGATVMQQREPTKWVMTIVTSCGFGILYCFTLFDARFCHSSPVKIWCCHLYSKKICDYLGLFCAWLLIGCLYVYLWKYV